MNKWVELLVGLVLVIGPIVIAYVSSGSSWDFWSAAGTVFRGGLFWAIIGLGALFILLGISDLKESK